MMSPISDNYLERRLLHNLNHACTVVIKPSKRRRNKKARVKATLQIQHDRNNTHTPKDPDTLLSHEAQTYYIYMKLSLRH